MSWSSAIVADSLSLTSARSSSASASPAPLKAYSRHARAPVMGLRFCLNPISGFSIHHQFVASAVALIMPYRPIEVAKQLLWCWYKILQQMTVIHRMFSCYLTYSAPQCRPRARFCLSIRPQRHRPPSCNVVRKDQAMVFVMPLILAFQVAYLFVHL